MRTNTGSSAVGSPMTRAITFSDLSSDSKPKSLNMPNGVGRRVSATFVTLIRAVIISPGRQLRGYHNIIGGSGPAVGAIRDQTKGGRPGHFVKDRLTPSVFPD